ARFGAVTSWGVRMPAAANCFARPGPTPGHRPAAQNSVNTSDTPGRLPATGVWPARAAAGTSIARVSPSEVPQAFSANRKHHERAERRHPEKPKRRPTEPTPNASVGRADVIQRAADLRRQHQLP